MFGLGTSELIVICAIAFLVFGGKKFPELGEGLGKAIGTFKRGLQDVEEAGDALKKSLPGVQETAGLRRTVDKAKKKYISL